MKNKTKTKPPQSPLSGGGKTEPADRSERIARGLWWDKALTLVEGCTMVSEACHNCWAATQTHTRAKQTNPKTKARYQDLTTDKGQFNGTVRMQWEALKIPFTVKTPTRFAVWNDLFHKDVTDEFIDRAFAMMGRCARHTFIILTKRPERMRKFITEDVWRVREKTGAKMESNQFPHKNIWLGVTVESPKYIHRIDELLTTPAAVRVISYEPALEYVDFEELLAQWQCPECLSWQYDSSYCLECNKEQWENLNDSTPNRRIHWIIMGCESGSKRRPMNIQWARKVQQACAYYRVPLFVKQMEVGGKVVHLPKLDGKTYAEFPTTDGHR